MASRFLIRSWAASLALLGLFFLPLVHAATPSLSSGTNHGLYLKPDGSVWAWGDNGDGQLGDGSTLARRTPQHIPLFSGITTVAADTTHNLTVKANGTVWAWGWNLAGQRGNGTTTYSLVPVQVGGLTNVTEIAAGGSFSLALKDDLSVWDWGINGDGQLGDGTTTSRSTPVAVSGIAPGGTAKAIDYSLKRWPALTRYATDGVLPIDNNPVENAIRPICLGKKNWLFVGSERAGKRAAAIQSLLATAALNGLDPAAWLRETLERLPICLNSEIDSLLPFRSVSIPEAMAKG